MAGILKSDVAEVLVARRVELWVHDEHAGRHTTRGMTEIRSVPDEVMFVIPESRRLGRPVIEAACVKEVAPYCCRLKVAKIYAWTHRLPLPRLTPAVSLLLKPCAGCLQVERAVLTASVHGGNVLPPKAQARKSLVASVVSSGKRNLHGVDQPCVTCHEWAANGRRALRAGADPVVLRPHRARPAPTGSISPVVHDGIDAPNCSCNECRGARQLRFDRSGGRR
jgi:hypothetical protein